MLLFVFPECVRERQKVNADLRGNRPRVCTFTQVQLAVFRGRCWGRLLHEQVDLTSTSHTHTYKRYPPSPPDPAALIITVATPIDVPRPTERVCGRPSAGLLHRDCGKSDLWCPWCCWPQTLTLTPLYSLFAFLPPSFCLFLPCLFYPRSGFPLSSQSSQTVFISENSRRYSVSVQTYLYNHALASHSNRM